MGAMVTTNPFDGDKFREECGVFGLFGHPDAGAHTALGLHALQHRGQEAAGIVSFDGDQFHSHRSPGLVGDHFDNEDVIKRLTGTAAIGHVRYSTTGETLLRNVQPLFADLAGGGLAIAHNGNLTNAMGLRRELEAEGTVILGCDVARFGPRQDSGGAAAGAGGAHRVAGPGPGHNAHSGVPEGLLR